jgi:amidase
MADITNSTFQLGVQGPLARSTADLQLMFEVIRGPEMFENIVWRLELPKPRHDKLEDFKVAVLPSIMDVHCSSQVQKKVDWRNWWAFCHLLTAIWSMPTQALISPSNLLTT